MKIRDSGGGIVGTHGLFFGPRVDLPLLGHQQVPHFLHELVDILEGAIDGREADVGYAVQLMELLHHLFPDNLALNLFFAEIEDGAFDAVHQGLLLLSADRALLEGLLDARREVMEAWASYIGGAP